MMIWLILLVFIICVVLLVLRATKGPTHTLETIDRPIKDLLNRGYDGSFLIVNIYRSKNFLQLRKYINAPDDYGIKLCFPNAKWSAQLFIKLKEFCDQNGIKYTIAEEKANKPLEFLYIDFAKEFFEAHKYVKNILLEVFGVNKNVKLFVRLENATIDDKLINR